MAGGTRIIINSDGIKIITPALFQAKAAEHRFEQGASVAATLPKLPESGEYSRRFDFTGFFAEDALQQGIRYQVINHTKQIQSFGQLDSVGRTPRFFATEDDDLEVVVLGEVTTAQEWKVTEHTQNPVRLDEASEVPCCAETTVAQSEQETELLQEQHIDLEADYHDFGH